MFLKLSILINFIIFCNAGEHKDPTTEDFILDNGYEVERHTTETPDGFVLTLFRIPGGEGSTPVYLQHGVVDSSDSWFSMGHNSSLGFILADEGYDVWAGNFRGNTYSKEHRTLTPNMTEYWRFSWDTLGKQDVRVMIQYILQVSGQPQLIHIGHSMGTTSFFVAASCDPKVNELVKAHIALAPITSFQYSKSPAFSAQFIEPLITFLQSYESDPNQKGYLESAQDAVEALPGGKGLTTMMASFKTYFGPAEAAVAGYAEMVTAGLTRIQGTVPDYFGLQEIVELINLAVETGEIRGVLIRKYCQRSPAHYQFCLNVLSVVQGDDEQHLNEDLIHLLFKTLPKSSSLSELLHFLQQRKAGKIFYYDFGTAEENMKEYGQPTPPEVNLGKIKVPVYFVYGRNDLFTSEEDLQASYKKFGNPSGIFPVERPEWNHADFLITLHIEHDLTREIVLTILNELDSGDESG